MQRLSYVIVCSIALIFAASSCSTTKVLSEGQQSLAGTSIIVENGKSFDTSELGSYLKQSGISWRPSLCIYNWQDGKGKGWDKFVTKLGKAPEIFDSTLVGLSERNVADHLEYLGYYGSTVKGVTTVCSNPKKVKVKYYVTLGKRYPISDVKYAFHGFDSTSRADFLKDTLHFTLRGADFLSESLLEEETAVCANTMRNKGYYDFTKSNISFRADTISDPGKALLTVNVLARSRNSSDTLGRNSLGKYTFGNVNISYPSELKFRDKVLRDLNTIKNGDLYSDRRVNMTQNRFNSISLFNSASVELTPREEGNVVDCNVMLHKGKIQGFKLGFEASVNSTGLLGLSPELSYYHKNIFHGGEVLSLSVSTNHQFQIDDSSIHSNEVTANLSLTIPRFVPFSTKNFKGSDLPSTVVKMSYNYQNRPEYQRNIFSASFGYQGIVKKHFQYQVSPLSIKVTGLPYIDEDFLESIINNSFLLDSFLDHFDMGATATLHYSSATSSNPHETFWYARFQGDFSGNVLSLFNSCLPTSSTSSEHLIMNIPYYQYVRGEFQIGRTWVWGRKSNQSLATRLLVGAGYAYGNSTAMPLEKQFYSGGANSLRGWTARTVGPGAAPLEEFWSIPNQTGDIKLEANVEYRFPIVWKLAGAVFVDAGNVWNIQTDLYQGFEDDPSLFHFNDFYKSIAASWGAGIRVDLSFLVLRFDMGMRFHDPALASQNLSCWVGPAHWLDKGNHAFHFGVGYPF